MASTVTRKWMQAVINSPLYHASVARPIGHIFAPETSRLQWLFQPVQSAAAIQRQTISLEQQQGSVVAAEIGKLTVRGDVGHAQSPGKPRFVRQVLFQQFDGRTETVAPGHGLESLGAKQS